MLAVHDLSLNFHNPLLLRFTIHRTQHSSLPLRAYSKMLPVLAALALGVTTVASAVGPPDPIFPYHAPASTSDFDVDDMDINTLIKDGFSIDINPHQGIVSIHF